MVKKSEEYNNFLLNCYRRQKEGVSWAILANEYAMRFGEVISRSAIRHRVQDYHKKINKDNFKLNASNFQNTFVQYNSDGSVEANKVIDLNDEDVTNPEKILLALGYDPSRWEIITYRVSEWDRDKSGVKAKSVQYKITPKKELSTIDIIKATNDAFKTDVKPLSIQYKKHDNKLCDKKLMEIAPIELHMGKLSHEIETGENYDLKIAQKRFYSIFEEIFIRQDIEKCGRCVLVIGSDFFNSESDNCTSVNKIPQENDSRYIKLFTEGIKMYTKVLLTLREKFNKVDVMLCAGNHARAMETFLYIALQQKFCNDNIINFIENYRHTQAYTFGNCAIFYNHGDANLKQTIKSIPAEFDNIWGTHPFRELHLGHLHKEVTVDDEGGMITRRIGSPCSTDAWHYSNRFVGALKKHQIFIWDAESGLKQILYIGINK